MGGTYELLEHTADVGIRASGPRLEDVFEATARAVAEILGAWFPGEGEPTAARIEAPDREALLVAWVDELLYLFETRDAVFGGFEVPRIGETDLEAEVLLAPIGERELAGQHVKAATYHRLRLAPEDGSWVGRIYLDV